MASLPIRYDSATFEGARSSPAYVERGPLPQNGVMDLIKAYRRHLTLFLAVAEATEDWGGVEC